MKLVSSDIILKVILMAFYFLSYSSHAQVNNSGVMGPNIDIADNSVQFRTALAVADENNQGNQWAYRVHYQHAFNEKYRGRIALQYRENDGFQYDFVRAELLYNFRRFSVDKKWSSSLRFDFRSRGGGRAEELALHWSNEWNFFNGYIARAVIVAAQQFNGDVLDNETLFRINGGVYKWLSSEYTIGVEIFSERDEFGSRESTEQEGFYFGPTLNGRVSRYKYKFRYLYGISSDVRDHNFMFQISTQI